MLFKNNEGNQFMEKFQNKTNPKVNRDLQNFKHQAFRTCIVDDPNWNLR